MNCLNRSRHIFAPATTVILLIWTTTAAFAQGDVHSESGDRGMVVSDSAHASRVGRDIIAKGGNAVDAAVATAFALAVTWPEAGNIGGGGFMMIRPADGKNPVCVDYREKAPLASAVDTFRKGESRHTRKVVGVPGTVRGLELAHKKFGQLPWQDLVMPAAKLAADGFSVDAFLARSANNVLDATKENAAFKELHRVYGRPGGKPWKTGDVMRLPDLGRTLTMIANEGSLAFYEGKIADLLLAETAKSGGLIRRRDLETYEAKIRQPIIGTYNGYTIIGAPPPSSGGIALVQGLNMVEAVDLPKNKYEPRTIHLLAEISRRFFLDRARHLGDPDFVDIPKHLTTKEYAQELVADINLNRATDSAALAADIKLADETEDTTHFSVIDADGMAVSNTYTIEASWGSRIVVPGAGFLLNNEMGDFNWVKGYTDRKGYIGSDANLLEPGKRMLSSQCPVIVTKNNKPVLITGSPGGRTILNTVFNVVLNVVHFDMSAPLAVQSKRFHHQWMPDVLYLEDLAEPPFNSTRNKLEDLGHKLVNRVSQGSAHSIWIDPDTNRFVGVADYRRGGRPAGISSLTTARWDFGGRKGEGLNDQQPTGRSRLSWSSEIAGSSVDGGDRYQIRRDAPEMPDRSYVQFAESPRSAHVTVGFDGINFAGESRNEKLKFSFTVNDSEKPLIVAGLTLARNEDNAIVVYGESLGSGTTSVEPTILSSTRRLDEAITVRLRVDQDTGVYTIGLRRPTHVDFETIGRGKTDRSRSIGFVRMRAMNDFSASGEYVRIDSIELETK